MFGNQFGIIVNWFLPLSAVVTAILIFLLLRPHSDRPERRALVRMAKDSGQIHDLRDRTRVMLLGAALGGEQLWAVMPPRWIRDGRAIRRETHTVVAVLTEGAQSYVHFMAVGVGGAVMLDHLLKRVDEPAAEDALPLPVLGRRLGTFPVGEDMPAQIRRLVAASLEIAD